MRISRLILALCMTFQLLGAHAARAQEEKDTDAIAKQHLDAAQLALRDADTAKAIDELQASLAAKQTPQAYFLLGNTYVKIGALDDAKVAYDQFLKLDPKNKKAPGIRKILDEMDVANKTKLAIQSSPPGATVYLDLKATGARGRTPITLAVDPGRHRVFLDAEGFEPVISTVSAEDGKVTPVAVTLQQKGCDLAISSTPPATVRIDDGAPRTSPVTERVSLGAHKIEFSGEGLAPKQKSVECKNYTSQVVSEFLEKMPNGWLSMKLPEGSSVTVDAKPVDLAKLAKLDLPPGDHTVDVTAPGKAPWHVTTKVRAGMQTDLAPRLDVGGLTTGGSSTGIEVVVDATATILLDGQPLRPMEPTATMPGTHSLVVEVAGSKPYHQVVTIKQGEVAIVDPVLERPSTFPIYAAAVAVVGAGALGGVAAWGWQNHEQMNVEQGALVGAGILGVGALAALTYYFVDRRSATKDRGPHLTAGAVPGRAAVMLEGRF